MDDIFCDAVFDTWDDVFSICDDVFSICNDVFSICDDVIFVGMSNLVLRMMYLVSEKISFIDPERWGRWAVKGGHEL